MKKLIRTVKECFELCFFMFLLPIFVLVAVLHGDILLVDYEELDE